MLDFPSLLYKRLRILMFQLSGVYCRAQGSVGFRTSRVSGSCSRFVGV